jgi:hypothetical protein
VATLNEIAAKLAALGLGTLGVDLFIGFLPATPPACGAVYEQGGLAPELGFGQPGILFETPALQVVFRGAPGDYAGPRAKAEAAYQGLAAVEAQTLSAGAGGTSAFYHWIHPQQAPFLLDRDDSQRVRIAFNALCEKEPSA